jgi:hypothetical protein
VAPTGDPDVWWHLRAGQLALAPGSLATDPFSYSFGGQPWWYRDVLADVILYSGFHAFGFPSFLALKILVAGVEGVALWLFLPEQDRRGSVLIAGFALLLATVPLVERPNLFTVAMFPLVLALLDRARVRDARALVPAVLACWAWLVLHRGGLLGVALIASLWVGLWVAGSASMVTVSRTSVVEKRWVALAAFLAFAIAPVLPFGLRGVASSFGVVGSRQLHQQISEWQRIDLPDLVQHFPLALGLAAIGLALKLAEKIVKTRRHPEGSVVAWHAILLGAFLAASRSSVRWVPYLAATAVLVVMRGVGAILRPEAGRREKAWFPVLVFTGALVALLVTRTAPFRLGEDRARLPVAAVDFLEQHGLDGKIANAFDEGGYLIWRLWPRVRVLVDGRNETLYPPEFLSRAIAAEHDPRVFASMRGEDRATIVVADDFPGRLTHGFLADDPAWALVSWSDAALVWVRRDAHPELASLYFTQIDPRAVDLSVERAFHRGAAAITALHAELGRMLAASPDSVRALVGVAIDAHLRGDPATQATVMSRLEAIAGDHPAVRALARRFQRP